MKLFIWQQFASNHSGSYTVVGKFETPEAAQQATETLLEHLTQLKAEYGLVPPDQSIASPLVTATASGWEISKQHPLCIGACM